MQKPETIRAITDPVQRIAAAHEAGEAARKLAAEYGRIPRETVRELRKSMSLGQIAELLGVSRGRIQQLEK